MSPIRTTHRCGACTAVPVLLRPAQCHHPRRRREWVPVRVQPGQDGQLRCAELRDRGARRRCGVAGGPDHCASHGNAFSYCVPPTASDAGLFVLGALPRPLSWPHPWAGQVSQVPTFYRVLLLLSVKTHWQVVTGNTKSWEAAGALAGTGPSVNGPDPGTR